jgi:hypothetical protein
VRNKDIACPYILFIQTHHHVTFHGFATVSHPAYHELDLAHHALIVIVTKFDNTKLKKNISLFT